MRGGWCSNEVRGSYGVGVWKLIRNGWADFLVNCRFAVDWGTQVSFWHDTWCGEVALKIPFPFLFRIAFDKDATVADNMAHSSNSTHWSVRFTRAAQDWELGDIAYFYSMLHALNLHAAGEDRLLWSSSGNKSFSIHSFYKVLSAHPSNAFPWKCIWRTKAPLKVAFFVWLASHGKIMTIDKMRRRDIYSIDWCYMCKHDSESADHLLLHCEVVKVLWDGIFTRLGMAWAMPRRVIELLACWRGIRGKGQIANIGKGQIANIWKMVPLCLMWCT